MICNLFWWAIRVICSLGEIEDCISDAHCAVSVAGTEEDLHNIDKVRSTTTTIALSSHVQRSKHNSKLSEWNLNTFQLHICGKWHKIGWKRMLTQDGIDTGDFCHTMVLKPFLSLYRAVARPPYPFPLNVSTLLCYDTPQHRNTLSLEGFAVHQDIYVWRAVNCRAPTWAHLSKWKPFHGQPTVFFTGRAEYFVNCHQKYFVKCSTATPRLSQHGPRVDWALWSLSPSPSHSSSQAITMIVGDYLWEIIVLHIKCCECDKIQNWNDS